MAQQTPRVRAIPEEWVELEHKGIEGTQKVSPSAVPHWRDRGWTPVTNKQAQARATGSES